MLLHDTEAAFLVRMLTSGGDRRIKLGAGADVNMYGASPFPRDLLGFAASTANDISSAAFDQLAGVVTNWPSGRALSGAAYGAALEKMRERIRAAYRLSASVDIVFAPSGTDLEFVALHLAQARSGRGVTNILLGADEVGSGCLLSADGRYFATETAVVDGVEKGARVEGFGQTRLSDIPVRDPDGVARRSDAIVEDIEAHARAALSRGEHPLAHIVHGSKTALVLPTLVGIDQLVGQLGEDISFVVDACQARIAAHAIGAYLDRGAIVLMTGSKYMGGPPFSGFALVPPAMATVAPLAPGLSTLSRRGEWPAHWRGADGLADDANPGLLLRLEASIFELERYQAIDPARRDAVILAFSDAVKRCADALGARLVAANIGAPVPGHRCLVETATLATIDLSGLPDQPDFAVATRWQRVLAARGIRVGQPVKCIKLPDGRWGGTLRISLSMPMIVELAALDAAALDARLASDMARIIAVLSSASRRSIA
jgi:hypothetical protein